MTFVSGMTSSAVTRNVKTRGIRYGWGDWEYGSRPKLNVILVLVCTKNIFKKKKLAGAPGTAYYCY